MGDFRLIPFCCRKHNRRGGFIVKVQQRQTDPRQQLGFAILASDLAIQGREPPRSVVLFPSENGGDEELLPRQKEERLSRPTAFGVAQKLFEKLDESVGVIFIKPNSTRMTLDQIVDVSLTRKSNPL
jgi:hypothetical protein